MENGLDREGVGIYVEYQVRSSYGELKVTWFRELEAAG